MAHQSSTASRVFNIIDLEEDIRDVFTVMPPAIRETRPVDYAPPAVRTIPPTPLPEYVEHREGVNMVGKLTAEAVVKEYELAAQEVEAMGRELKERVDQCDAMKAGALLALDQIKETAASYREEAKRFFLQIEDCSLMTTEVRNTCTALTAKIAGPTGQSA